MRIMLRVAAFAVVVVCALATGAGAQVFYSYPGARPVTDASPSLGLVAGFGDNLIRLGGFGRFNPSPSADLRAEALYNDGKGEDSTNYTGLGGARVPAEDLFPPASEDM